jgi:hypothetical protein
MNTHFFISFFISLSLFSFPPLFFLFLFHSSKAGGRGFLLPNWGTDIPQKSKDLNWPNPLTSREVKSLGDINM